MTLTTNNSEACQQAYSSVSLLRESDMSTIEHKWLNSIVLLLYLIDCNKRKYLKCISEF